MFGSLTSPRLACPAAALLVLLLVPLLAPLWGCAGAETAIRPRLVPDPTLNSTAQLLARLDTVQLILDAAGGFAGVQAAGQAAALDAQDLDADGVLELVLRRPARGAFPSLELLPGSNLERSFELRLVGLPSADPSIPGSGDSPSVAVGGLAVARFQRDAIVELAVPFNLRPGQRPPRVSATSPAAGQTVQSLAAISVEFSAPVVAESLSGNLQLLFRGASGVEQLVTREWLTETRRTLEWGIAESHSVALAALPSGCTPAPGTYRVEARSGIRDGQGRDLSQDISDPTARGFSATFTVAGTPGTSACTSSCTPGITCPVTCNCPPKTVCDKTQTGSQGQCVPDCRLGDATGAGCANTATSCDPKTGLCVASPPPPDCTKLCADFCTQSQDPQACDACLIKNNCKKG